MCETLLIIAESDLLRERARGKSRRLCLQQVWDVVLLREKRSSPMPWWLLSWLWVLRPERNMPLRTQQAVTSPILCCKSCAWLNRPCRKWWVIYGARYCVSCAGGSSPGLHVCSWRSAHFDCRQSRSAMRHIGHRQLTGSPSAPVTNAPFSESAGVRVLTTWDIWCCGPLRATDRGRGGGAAGKRPTRSPLGKEMLVVCHLVFNSAPTACKQWTVRRVLNFLIRIWCRANLTCISHSRQDYAMLTINFIRILMDFHLHAQRCGDFASLCKTGHQG